MKKILLGFVILFFIAAAGYGQEPNQEPELTITSDKEVYKAGEEIVIKATIKNNSNNEMIMFWNNQKPVLREIVGGYLTEYVVSIPSSPTKDVETLYIKAKSVIKKEIFLKISEKWKFILTLEYNFPNITLDFQTGPNQKIWQDTLVSNTITIEVVGKK